MLSFIIGAIVVAAFFILLRKKPVDYSKRYEENRKKIEEREKADREKVKGGTDEEAQAVLSDSVDRNNERMRND
jgi:uncharacterized membrane protein (DUF106 family)